MHIAYLILAHDNPAHVRRLVQRLAAPGVTFYIHVDAKADLAAFAGLRPAVRFCDRRINCGWGDISLVIATLELMKCASSGLENFDRFVLLSGACYPLHTPAHIDRFLARHRDTEFIEVFSLPNAEYNKSLDRISRIWIRKGKPLARLRWPIQNVFNKILPKRNYEQVLAGGEPVTGSQWWCLTREAVQYVLDVTARQPELYRFCKFVDCPDEFYFQFILWNSPFRERISHSLTFTHWTPGKNSPELIDESYLPRFVGPVVLDSLSNNCPNEKREVLFARKFSGASAAVLDAIDALAMQRQQARCKDRSPAIHEVPNGQN